MEKVKLEDLRDSNNPINDSFNKLVAEVGEEKLLTEGGVLEEFIKLKTDEQSPFFPPKRKRTSPEKILEAKKKKAPELPVELKNMIERKNAAAAQQPSSSAPPPNNSLHSASDPPATGGSRRQHRTAAAPAGVAGEPPFGSSQTEFSSHFGDEAGDDFGDEEPPTA